MGARDYALGCTLNVLTRPGNGSAASLSTGEQCQGVPYRAALSVLAIAGSIVLWGVDLRLADFLCCSGSPKRKNKSSLNTTADNTRQKGSGMGRGAHVVPRKNRIQIGQLGEWHVMIVMLVYSHGRNSSTFRPQLVTAKAFFSISLLPSMKPEPK